MHPEYNRPDPLPQAGELFARHLDLTPLRGRRRGLVRCPFHQDRSPSLSVDLDRGVFHCFGCGVSGGVNRFAELVGEVEPSPARPARPRSPLAEVLARVRAEARRQLERLAPYRDIFIIAGFIREGVQLAAEARRVATATGPTERAWDLLEKAARVEAAALGVEGEVDDLFPLPRQQDLDAGVVGERS